MIVKWSRFFNTISVRFLKDVRYDTAAVKPNIKELLAESKLTYTNGHSSYILTPCPFCRLNQKEQTSLFINKTTGGSVCKPCNLKGTWSDISRMLKQQKQHRVKKVTKQLQKLLPQSLKEDFWTKECVPWKKAEAGFRNATMELFKIEKLKPNNIEKYGLSFTKSKFTTVSGESEEMSCLVFPWYSSNDGGCVPDRVKMETVSPLGKRLIDHEPKEGSPGLFGWNTVPKQANKLVITAGEFDAIAVHQCTGLPAVSLPMGSSTLPPEILPQLENFSSIFLWFGSDARGRQASAQFATKLNVSRCFIICPPSEKQQFSSALDALNKGLDLREIVNSAKPANHKQIMTFQQLREEVYSEFLNADQVAGVKWQRFPELTQVLKGFRPGELTIFTGPTGSGKTTLMSELSLDLCSQGVSTLWGSFEIRNVRLAKTMLKQFSGVNLEKCLSQYEYWADRFQQLPLYYMGFHGPMETATVIDTMAHAVYVYDIQHIIIDNLQFMVGTKLRGFDDGFFAQNHAVAQFRHFASSKNVHVSIIMHPRKEDEDKPLQTSSIFGTAKATQEADNVLILQSQPKKEKFLQITKNRFSGDLGKVPLQFNRSNLTFSQSKPQKSSFEKKQWLKSMRKSKIEDLSMDEFFLQDQSHLEILSDKIPSSEVIKPLNISDQLMTNNLKPLKSQSKVCLPVDQIKNYQPSRHVEEHERTQ